MIESRVDVMESEVMKSGTLESRVIESRVDVMESEVTESGTLESRVTSLESM